MVSRVRVVDVRSPSGADMYTAPPSPFVEVHVVNEHPVPNVSEDSLPRTAFKAAPFPSDKQTLSTANVVKVRDVPDAAVMSEQLSEAVSSGVDGLMSTVVRVSEPEETENSVHVSEVVVIEKLILLTVTLASAMVNTTVPELRLSNCFVCDSVLDSGSIDMNSEANCTEVVSWV